MSIGAGVTRRKLLGGLGFALEAIRPSGRRPPGEAKRATFDVRDFGAVADGVTVSTKAIQAAIDACATTRGGSVLVQGGVFVSGTLFLKSNVTLFIDAGATLNGSTKISDYVTGTHRNMYAGEAHLDRCLIFARDARNVGLEGKGTIDGAGNSFPNRGDAARNRPMLLRLLDCQNVAVRDLTLQNPGAWTSAFLYCRDVHVDGLTILSRGSVNGDGLDFDGCQNVRVSNCRMDNGDDSISLQASRPSQPTRNIAITNCVISSRWAAIRIGLLSRGDFEDITVSNCVFHDIDGEAIKIQMAEGGRMARLNFSSIVMRNVSRPVFVTLNSFPFAVEAEGEQMPPIQSLQRIMFSDIQIEANHADGESRNSFIALLGVPGHPIADVSFNNISFTAAGGGSKEDAARQQVPELVGMRPERKPLGSPLPSYAVYARHVRDLKLHSVTLATRDRDCRPGVICEDVENLRLAGVELGGGEDAEALIILREVNRAFIQGCAPSKKCQTFLQIDGPNNRQIALLGNDLRRADRGHSVAGGALESSVVETGNLH